MTFKNSLKKNEVWQFLQRCAAISLLALGLSTITARAQTCVPPPSGLVAWWTANGNALDSAGFNNGVLMHGAGFTNGEVSQAFTFDGVQSYVEVPYSASLNITNSLTLEAWIFPQPQTIGRMIMGKWTSGGDYPEQRAYDFYLDANGNLGFGVSDATHEEDATFQNLVSPSPVAMNQWSHVAGVYDRSTGDRRLYINGVLAAERTNTPVTLLNAMTKFAIGARLADNTNAVDFFAGRIDEASVYNRALSAAEIQSIFNAGSQGKCRPGTAPIFAIQPQNQTVTVGTDVTLVGAATGANPLSYQWQFNGAAISGASKSVLNLTDVQLSAAGNYSVTVTNAFGAITSSNAVLTVTGSTNGLTCVPPPSGLVAWWTANGNALDYAGFNNGALMHGAGFTNGEVSQAFTFDGVGSYVEVPYSASLNITNSLTLEAWIFPQPQTIGRMIMGRWSNAGAFAGMRSYDFYLNPAGDLGFGVSDATFQEDGDFQNLETTNHPVAMNQWSHVAGVYDASTGVRRVYINGVLISQRTNTSITLLNAMTKFAIGARLADNTNATDFFAGRIDEASVYNRALSTAEIQAIFNAGSQGKCLPTAGTAPTIVAQPQSQSVTVGANVTLAAQVAGTSPLSFQWRFNSTAISGATSASFGLNNVQLSAAGNYSVTVANAFGAINSSNALLTVNGLPPGISSQPASQTVGIGAQVNLSITATGTAPLSYQWQIHDDPLLGATNASLNLTNVQLSDSGFYDAIVTNAYGSITSSYAVLSVTGMPSQIASQPLNQTVTVGTTVQFSVTTRGFGPFTFQWRFNGNNIFAATNSTLNLGAVQLSAAGTYSVVVANLVYSTTSSNAVLTVNPAVVCTPAPSGIVSWWPADGSAADLTGSNSGVLVNGAGFTNGEVAQSFSFNGTSQYVLIADSPSLNPAASFSIEGWIYPLANGTSSQVIMGKWGDTGGFFNQRCYTFDLQPNGVLQFPIADLAHQWDGAFQAFTTSNNAVALNAWSHVAAVYDQTTGTRRIFVNGVKVAERTDAPITILNANTVVGIGAGLYAPNASGFYFTGKIDELSFYSRALAAADIQSIFNAGSQGKCHPTIGTPPTFVSQPHSQSVTVGTNVTLAVQAAGTSPLSYQWQFNSAAISGATSSLLTLNNVQLSDAGNYSVTVTNAFGSVTSSNAALAVTGSTNGLTCVPPPSGLVAWWTANGNALDYAGFNNGALMHGAGFTNGEVSQAFTFDGVQSYVEVPYSASLNITNSLTLEAWIFPQPQTIGRMIMGRWSNEGAFAGMRSYDFYLNPAGDLGFGVSDATFQENGDFQNLETTNHPVAMNQWSHVAGVYDQSTGARRLYINGVLIAQRTNTSITLLNAMTKFAIGARLADNTNATDFFAGRIDEASVYNRALSTAEIQAIFNAGSQGKCPVTPASTQVQIASVSTSSGALTVPINLVALGAENAVGFSVVFDPTYLTFANISLGHGATNASAAFNTNQVASGRIGAAIILPVNATFAVGTQELAEVSFIVNQALVNLATNPIVTAVSFGDQPTVRQVSNPQAIAVPATFIGGTATLSRFGYEGDVSPRGGVDGAVTITDWVQIGRFVAGLDTITNAAEFQRADCAPRSTLGDGVLTAADWVQAGRYAAGMDPLTYAGGPSGGPGFVATGSAIRNDLTPRILRVVSASALAAQTVQVSVQLDAQGNENTLGFSLVFDPSVITLAGASLGSSVQSAMLIVNTNQAAKGKLGVLLGLPFGQVFTNGALEVLKLNLAIAATAGNTNLTFASGPVALETTDAAANALTTTYQNGMVAVVPLAGPTLRATVTKAGLVLTWPAATADYAVEMSTDLGAQNWTPVVVSPTPNGTDVTVTVPFTGSQRYYRLHQQ